MSYESVFRKYYLGFIWEKCHHAYVYKMIHVLFIGWKECHPLDAAYDTMLTFLLSNISCCYPKSPLDILLKEKCIYSSGSCPASHSNQSLRVTQFLHICRLLNPKWRLPGARSSSTGKETRPQSLLRCPVNHRHKISGTAHNNALNICYNWYNNWQSGMV